MFLRGRHRTFNPDGSAFEVDVGPSRRADLAAARPGRSRYIELATQLWIGLVSENKEPAYEYFAGIGWVYDG